MILSLRVSSWIKKSLSLALIGLVLPACSVAETFSNTNPKVVPKSLGDVIEWRITKDPSPDRVAIEVSNEWQNLTPESTHYAIWIGHATFLINTGDVTVLTDPIFSQRASPVSWAGPERLIAPAMSLQQLPPIDAVVISSNWCSQGYGLNVDYRDGSLGVFSIRDFMSVLNREFYEESIDLNRMFV